MLDAAIVHFDRILRSLAAPATTVRPVPGSDLSDMPMSEDARRHAAALMRINHCGEIWRRRSIRGRPLLRAIRRSARSLSRRPTRRPSISRGPSAGSPNSADARDIQNNLDKTFHFDTLVLDESIFSSFADKREIKIDGNTYDVYQMHRLSGDKIQIIAFKDNLEDRLLQEITNLFENQDQGSSKIKLLTCPDWCFHSIEQKKSPGINRCKQEFNYLPLSGKEINLSFLIHRMK